MTRFAFMLVYAFATATATAQDNVDSVRDDGLIALYDFSGIDGVVRDRSQVQPPLNLSVQNPGRVIRLTGSMELNGETVIQSSQPATKIIKAVRRSGELTIEAWIRPGKLQQSGPARIVSLSKDTNQRNFTFGQENDRFEIRLRTTKTSKNGIPSVTTASGSVTKKLMHVVFTRDRAGTARVFIDGCQVASERVPGDLSNWSTGFRFALANELGLGRPWLGDYHLVALYSQALTPREVQQKFDAGWMASRCRSRKSRCRVRHRCL